LPLTILTIGLTVWRMQPSSPLSANAPAARFSAGQALAILQQLLAEGQPRPSGSPVTRVLCKRVTTRLQSIGYIVETEYSVSYTCISPHTSQCTPVYNILARSH